MTAGCEALYRLHFGIHKRNNLFEAAYFIHLILKKCTNSFRLILRIAFHYVHVYLLIHLSYQPKYI